MGDHQRSELVLGSRRPGTARNASGAQYRVAVDEAMSTSLLETLDQWVTARRQPLAAKGIKVSVTRGPADRTPAAAWVDFESATRAARLTVWADGQADLAVLDFEQGQEILEEHREITGVVGLDEAELTVLALFQ